MPGNKKPRRQHGVKTGSEAGKLRAWGKGVLQAQKERKKQQERADRLNALPMSHPVSRHMIVKTMAPLYRFLEQHETQGGFVMEDGEPVLWDGEHWIQVIPGILHMCFIFEQMGRARTWPKMPEGLRAYVLGLQIGRKITPDDFKDSRETIAWMEQWMGTLTPLQWQELFNWATSLDEKNEAKHANV